MAGWPQDLPVDGWQPWEDRTPSALTDAEYLAGAERFQEGGDVEAVDETLQLSSGVAGEQAVSYSVYRLALGATEPGVVAVDVNVKPRQGVAGEQSTYFLGLPTMPAMPGVHGRFPTTTPCPRPNSWSMAQAT
jgi:hypothetical protein